MDFSFNLGSHPGPSGAPGRSAPPFGSVLIANRGEIAVRIIRTLQRLGVRTIAVYSDADAEALHVQLADEAVHIGPAAAAQSYLDIDAVVRAAVDSGADAVHPGYGFLSENARFADALAEAGVTFIGPGVEALAVMGDKITAKNHVAASGVPTVPGYAGTPGSPPSDEDLRVHAAGVGYPLLIKPSAGGGGKGMVVVESAEELDGGLVTARRVAAKAFGDDTLFIERLVRNPRHIEVQVLADTHGNVIHLGERECSLQRRHQKVIEEAPSALLESLPNGAEIRERMGQAACDAARSVDYVGAGTVEFLVSDDNPDEFFFMEMNTRLQVEHPVTEEVTGVDLVEQQLRVAAGEPLALSQDQVRLNGHAIEARVYAEDPRNGFLPATGTVLLVDEQGGRQIPMLHRAVHRPSPRPTGLRIDSSLFEGQVIGSDYDPMLAKVIVHGTDRADALAQLDLALSNYRLLGLNTNVEYLRLLLADEDVQAGRLDTGLIERKLDGFAFHDPDEVDLAFVATLADRNLSGATRRVSGGLRGWSENMPGSGLWSARDGWRLGEPLARPVEAMVSGRELHAEVTGGSHPGSPLSGLRGWEDYDIVMPGVPPIQITTSSALVAGVARVRADGRERVYALTLPGVMGFPLLQQQRTITAWIGRDGWSTEIEILDRAEALSRRLAALDRTEGEADPQVLTPMPGTVVAVAVQDGDVVQEGDHLLSVEAMKMEHQLRAPLAGTVKLSAAVGQLVKARQILATIHPVSADPDTTEAGA
ncbi:MULTISPECIES: biotin carboxylase N-terminal domain-containing protein [Arthrobacter]|uniref:biotin carboxylase n=2 Tax=Arthrobacter TaxID=1663 RepID=A0ABU9KPQ6_9MICC|nr:biotin carboxylase N-terminal domain-containing protein [Arthrobacter sp. YJM1]MDP5227801.1 biotin carboxylase N-terminal domain-containing protein [Arthrobacter sp. YJM1]